MVALPRAFHSSTPNLCSASYRVYSSHHISPPPVESSSILCADAKRIPKSLISSAKQTEEATRARLARISALSCPLLTRLLSQCRSHPCSSDASLLRGTS